MFTTKRKKERDEKQDRQVENLAFCLQRAVELTDQPSPFFFSFKKCIMTVRQINLQQAMPTQAEQELITCSEVKPHCNGRWKGQNPSAHCITKIKSTSLHHPLGHHLLPFLSPSCHVQIKNNLKFQSCHTVTACEWWHLPPMGILSAGCRG